MKGGVQKEGGVESKRKGKETIKDIRGNSYFPLFFAYFMSQRQQKISFVPCVYMFFALSLRVVLYLMMIHKRNIKIHSLLYIYSTT